MKVKLNNKVWVSLILISILATSLISYGVFGTGSAPNIPNIYHDVNPSGAIVDNDGANGWYWYSYNGQLLYNSTSATSVIESAIGNYSTVTIKSGSYTVSTQIYFSGISNIDLIFDKGAKLTAGTNLNLAVIYLNACNNWLIQGGEINGNAANQNAGTGYPNWANGIQAYACNNVLITQMNIYNCKIFGVFFDGNGASPFGSHNGLTYSNLTSNLWNGAEVSWSTYCYFDHNEISHSSDVGISSFANYTSITNNYIHDLDQTSGGGGNSQVGVYIEAQDPEYAYFDTIAGNTIVNVAEGIKVTAGSNHTQVGPDNTIVNYDRNTAYLPAIDIGSVYNQVVGNIVKQETTGTGPAIDIFANYTEVASNRIYLNAQKGIRVNSPSNHNSFHDNLIKTGTGGYVGIWLISGATYNQVFENDVSLATDTPKINNAGGATNLVWRNIGFVTENSGTALNATATTFSISHGLEGTPTVVFYTFNSTDITAASWTSTSSTITITVVGMANKSYNYTCYWSVQYVP